MADPTTTPRATTARSTSTAPSWTNVLLGLAILAVPFFTQDSTNAYWNNVITGLVVAGVAGYNVWAIRNTRNAVPFTAGLNVVLGIWIVASPFVFAVGNAFLWSNVILGGLLAIVAGYNAYVGSSAGRRSTRRIGH